MTDAGHTGTEGAQGTKTSRRALKLALLTGAASLGITEAALAAERSLMGEAAGLFAPVAVTALSVFAVTTAILYVRERGRWTATETRLNREIGDLSHRADRAAALESLDDCVLITWAQPGAEALIEGEAGFLNAQGRRPSPLAFGSWALPDRLKDLSDAVEALKARGTPFDLTVPSRSGGLVEARGRAVSGRAVLRLKDMTGVAGALRQVEAERDRLADAARRQATLLDGLDAPVWARDSDGRLVFVNAAYARAIDAPSPEAAIAAQGELMEREEREEAAVARGARLGWRKRATAVVAGQRLTFDLREAPSGIGSIGFAIDVSEVEEVRAALRRQLEAHVRTLDRLPTAIAVFDGQQRLAYRNAAYETLWSLEPAWLDTRPSDGEVLDRLRTERRLPEVGAGKDQMITAWRDWKAQRLKAYSATEASEDWWYLPDGRTLRLTASPNPQGGVIYVYDDATERFSLQSQVNALSRLQAQTLDGLREGVALFGSDGRLRLSNPAFAEMWKLSPAMLGNQPHVDEVFALCRLLSGEHEAWASLRGAIVGVRDRREDMAARMARQDGSVLDVALAPLPDGASLITFADVTDNVNVERALTERNEALEAAARLRDDFVHHVSYALRSPLTSIIGFAQLIGEEIAGPLNERQRDYAQLILRSSGTLLTIINDILDLASIDNQELRLDLAEVELADILREAARGLDDLTRERNIRFEFAIAPDIGPVRADGRRLRQAFYNLMSNAVGFSDADQPVRVEARREGDAVVVSVRDHGRGIPDEVRERIFDRFQSYTAGSRHRGVGLGLAIVRSFIGLHGGSVSVEPAHDGPGTVATCRIPLARAPLTDAAE